MVDLIEIAKPLTRLKSTRQTPESLRKEKFLFLTQTEPYDKDNAFHLLVQRVEALLSQENIDWAQSMMKPPKGEKSA